MFGEWDKQIYGMALRVFSPSATMSSLIAKGQKFRKRSRNLERQHPFQKARVQDPTLYTMNLTIPGFLNFL